MNNFFITLISIGLGIAIVSCLAGAAWLLDTYYDRKDIKEWHKTHPDVKNAKFGEARKNE